MLLDMFAALLGSIVQAFRQELTPVLRDLDMADSERFEESVPMLAVLVRKYRQQAAELANQLMAEEAAKVGGQALVPPVEGYADQAVHEMLTHSRSIDQVSRSLERHVRTAARRQVVRAVPAPVVPSASETNPSVDEVEVDEDGNFVGETEEGFEARPASKEESQQPAVYPIGWARVLTGKDNCAFCIVLASRGPVYSSRHHASSTSSKHWDKEGRQWANSYHDNCDCLVVPVYDPKNWAGKAQADALYKVYEEVTRNATAGGKNITEGNDKLKAFSNYLRDLKKDGKELEYPALEELDEIQSVSDETKKPTKTPVLKSVIPPGEKLESHEIEFLKRFEAHGQTAHWIANDTVLPGVGLIPANDFHWVEKGYQFTELKTSKNKYSTIATRIRDAVVSARTHKHPVAKEHFVIDLGHHKLSDKLRYQLSGYNLRKSEAQIKSLWVMHSDGKGFEEIKLQ
ncbi:hypothetical protein E4U03_11285 [Rothia nasimurium]|uniref:tRNA nuclease CdiA C-terminal domain-containing protein n=1 Tax=Rothia nasimurium TaxID=85336 RepID=A0A4Y9F251_9MICC|nr:hypothetical protein [Rothia nasimurium]MBF0809182.1 hypothetical protein [Rothia nasimurium]TFU20531.1 hypothetical protein E4U03_11285 [Rothia nasimurium]